MAEKPETKKPTIPTNAKKPQDRQTAKRDAVPEDVSVQWEGQDYEIGSDAFDDAEVLEYLVEAQDGKGQYYILALKSILGPAQWASYKAATKAASPTGRVSNQAAQDFLKHIMDGARQGNS